MKESKKVRKKTVRQPHIQNVKRNLLYFFVTLSNQLENGSCCESEKLNGHYHHAMFERS